jgi:hypothetical protein
MTEFNEEQLKTIRDLAEVYFKSALSWDTLDINWANYESLMNSYVDSIIAGLKDPDVWGLTQAQKDARVES